MAYFWHIHYFLAWWGACWPGDLPVSRKHGSFLMPNTLMYIYSLRAIIVDLFRFNFCFQNL